MTISDIPVITVSYNAPSLILQLLQSFRRFYTNKVYVIDGSNAQKAAEISEICNTFENVEFIHFNHNIHHGPGMAWAFTELNLPNKVLVLDSDVIVVRGGFIEAMLEYLEPDHYGAGSIHIVNEEGFDMPNDVPGIRYLHPACMICNLNIVREWPLPIKHGAPMFETMKALHNAGKASLIKEIPWLWEDFKENHEKHFLIHDWQGTVKINQSYELNDWMETARRRKLLNDAILSMIPETTNKIVEFGENDGFLARNAKLKQPALRYIAFQNISNTIYHAKTMCDEANLVNLDRLTSDDIIQHSDADCWILDQALERMNNPSQLLNVLGNLVSSDATIIIIIPNAQNIESLLVTAAGTFANAPPDEPQKVDRQLYSLEGVTKLLTLSGFSIVSGTSIQVGRSFEQGFVDALSNMLTLAGLGHELTTQRLFAERFILKIKKNA